ncbi:MAG: EAL domain-containing protein [Phycisphaeraceae bacterium]
MMESQSASAVGRAGRPSPASLFIGRQPIFDARRQVVAYELLFRCDSDNHCPATDADLASLATLNSSLNVVGLRSLVGDKLAFVNVTRELLIGQTLRMLPPGQVVIELLETIEADDEVLAALAELKEEGFTIALDDFVLTPRTEPLVAMADLIKLDLLLGGIEGCRKLMAQTRRPGLKYLAEKVESDEVFAQMKQLGCTMFQGFFFARPQVLKASRLGTGRVQSMRLMKMLAGESIDFAAAEAILKQDVTFSLKLLTYLNSAGLGLKHEVTSIRHAVALLGEIKLRQWVSLVAMTMLVEDKPTELARLSMVRARFLESVAPLTRHTTPGVDPFLLGLFSLLDAMLDQEMAQAVEQLALTDAMKNALTGRDATLNPPLAMARACERGEWNEMDKIAASLSMNSIIAADHYRCAMRWADEVMTIDA